MSNVKLRARNVWTASSSLFRTFAAKFGGPGNPPAITSLQAERRTSVDDYWSEHTVCPPKIFRTAGESEKYLEWRSQAYPLFVEFMGLYGQHDDQVVLDYGCGPGNDLVGFAIHTQARKIIGVDISEKALSFARQRLALHDLPPGRVELIQSADSIVTLPLEDASVDYINCVGVLQHTSSPEALLLEFYRVLRPGSQACVMVYNQDSVWLHLYTAYQRIILENAFPGLDAYEAFSKNVDGVNCPLARCYKHEEFMALCASAGFITEYIGGYLSDTELEALDKYRDEALRDERLAEEHKQFIRSLVVDERGFPTFNDKHAGVGGVYRLHKE